MDNLVAITFMPAEVNKCVVDRQTVLGTLHDQCQKRSFPDLTPYRIIISPYALPLSIADALLDAVQEVMVDTNDMVVESSHQVDVAAKLREKGQMKKLKPLQGYCENLPAGQCVVVVLSTPYANKTLNSTTIKFGFTWSSDIMSSSANEITVDMQPKLKAKRGNYAADDLLARLQLRGIKEAQAVLQAKEEELGQIDLLDSTKTALKNLPSKLPAPATFTLPQPPQSQPVDISTFKQSTEDLLSSLSKLKSALHSST